MLAKFTRYTVCVLSLSSEFGWDDATSITSTPNAYIYLTPLLYSNAHFGTEEKLHCIFRILHASTALMTSGWTFLGAYFEFGPLLLLHVHVHLKCQLWLYNQYWEHNSQIKMYKAYKFYLTSYPTYTSTHDAITCKRSSACCCECV